MTQLKRILVATDLSARSDRAVMRAAQLAQTHGAALEVLSVLDDAMPQALTDTLRAKALGALEAMADTLPGAIEPQIQVVTGYPSEAILAQAAGADLLVLGTHRPRVLLDELRETTAQRVSRQTGTPVLLVTGRADTPYAQVLAACDFSPAATAAMALARALAPWAELTALYALHVPYSGMLASTGTSAERLEATFRQEIEAEAEAWKAQCGLPSEDTARLEIDSGAPFALLRQRTAASGADLIAIGAHGRVGAARSLLGSLASDLMRAPPTDLLIVRP